MALEQPIELERKGVESLPGVCYRSVTEDALQVKIEGESLSQET